ncbi:MAG: Uma2 family endonuclease [Elainellaceae cyanobacterium]
MSALRLRSNIGTGHADHAENYDEKKRSPLSVIMSYHPPPQSTSPQPTPPLSPRETLPSMYDLPSEAPEEPGLPDEFHDLQPQLLSATLRLSRYASSEWFAGTDLNLYYDVRHPQWYKRPDWFLALGVERLYDGTDLRSSYVIWQEGVTPFIVVELLSPGTEKEDLGDRATLTEDAPSETRDRDGNNGNSTLGQLLSNQPPQKWTVYEQILRVPYYFVFSRYTDRLRFFKLVGGSYQEQEIDARHPRFWIPELDLGIGLWHGVFEGVERQWLRWYDAQDRWIPTDAERAERLAARLRELGEDPDALV